MSRHMESAEAKPTGLLAVRLERESLDRLLAYAEVQCKKHPDKYPSHNDYFVHKLTLASELSAKVDDEKHEAPTTGPCRKEPLLTPVATKAKPMSRPKPRIVEPLLTSAATKAKPMSRPDSLIPIRQVRRYYSLSQREVLARLTRCRIQTMLNDVGEECIHERVLPRLLRAPV